VTRYDLPVIVHNQWIDKLKPLDGIGNLPNLLLGVRPRVALRRLEAAQWEHLNGPVSFNARCLIAGFVFSIKSTVVKNLTIGFILVRQCLFVMMLHGQLPPSDMQIVCRIQAPWPRRRGSVCSNLFANE
jgi:hypothetical protein